MKVVCQLNRVYQYRWEAQGFDWTEFVDMCMSELE